MAALWSRTIRSARRAVRCALTTRLTATTEFLCLADGRAARDRHSALRAGGLPREWAHWPLGRARAGRPRKPEPVVEKQIGRNPAFWRWALPGGRTASWRSLDDSNDICRMCIA